MRRNKGFTLVELLAVIVVLALIMIIAVPAIMNVMEDARKQSFYIYANNVYQKAINKYVDDMNSATRGKLDCSTYKLPTDLDISNSGDYIGWVKVQRIATSSGNNSYKATISNPGGLFAVKYCTMQGGNCNPDVDPGNDTYKSATWDVGEDDQGKTKTSTTIQTTAPEGYTMCYQYQYPDANGYLKKVGPTCVGGTPIAGDAYDYKVTLTMKDSKRAVENLVMKDASVDETFKKTFYEAMDSYQTNHSTKLAEMPISELTCSGEGQTISGPGVGQFETTQIGTTTTSTATVQVTVPGVTEQSSTVIGTTQIPETTTVTATLPTSQVVDDSALLQDLQVSGFNINFTPGQFSYNLTVPYAQNALSINYVAKDQDSQVQLIGNDNIGIGNNTITIDVINNTTQKHETYHIYVFRLGDPNAQVDPEVEKTRQYQQDTGLPDPTLASSNAKLSNIVIAKYKLGDVFSPDTFTYDVEVEEGTTELGLSPILQSKEAHYTIRGNENLAEGSEVVITVQSGNGYYSNQYILTVHIKKKTKASTVALRAVAVGLAAVLGVLVLIMNKQKKASNLINNATNKADQNNNYVQPTQVNNNNNQGNV